MKTDKVYVNPINKAAYNQLKHLTVHLWRFLIFYISLPVRITNAKINCLYVLFTPLN